MISYLMKLTGLDSIFVYLIVAGVIVAGVYGFGWYKYDSGYDQAKIEYSLQIEKLKSDYATKLADALEHQSNANEIAKANEAQKIIAYETQLALRDKIIKENADEAKADPSSSRCGMSANGLRRIERIK